VFPQNLLLLPRQEEKDHEGKQRRNSSQHKTHVGIKNRGNLEDERHGESMRAGREQEDANQKKRNASEMERGKEKQEDGAKRIPHPSEGETLYHEACGERR